MLMVVSRRLLLLAREGPGPRSVSLSGDSGRALLWAMVSTVQRRQSLSSSEPESSESDEA